MRRWRMESLDGWPTLEEIHKKTGISDRTLHRRVNDGTLRKAYRQIPGRKPLLVVHPDDAAALENTTLQPVPVSNGTVPATRQNGNLPSSDILPVLAGLAQIFEKKLYLSLKEAARFSGLPLSFLRSKVQTKELPAVKIGGWRIKRQDLERYDAATGKLTKVAG
jgi:excisionase family DNA binding protein